MKPFAIEAEGQQLRLTLAGEVTIADAQALADALRAELRPEQTLAVDASELIRFDAAILQILLSCAQRAADTTLLSAGQAWSETFHRYASPDPFRAAQ